MTPISRRRLLASAGIGAAGIGIGGVGYVVGQDSAEASDEYSDLFCRFLLGCPNSRSTQPLQGARHR